MKTEKKTKKKFVLEKFEVAKLKNLNLIIGGVGEGGGNQITGDDLPTITDTSKNCNNNDLTKI